jgi:hypothetical protein
MFSDFRELVGSRRTCFPSRPHACLREEALDAAAAARPDADEL